MGCFVLQNKKRQTVRTFRWENSSLIMVYRNDKGRIEAVNSTDELDKNKIQYSIIATTTQNEIKKKDLSLGGFGYLSYQTENGVLAPSFSLPAEEDQLKRSIGFSALGTVSLIGLLMIVSFIANTYFTEEKIEPVVINIAPPPVEPVRPVEKVKTVKVAKQKIQKIKPHQTLSHKTVVAKPKPKKVTVIKKIAVKKDIPANKGPDIHQMGALAALSSVKKSSKMSLNLNGVGQAEGGSGSGGRGYGGSGSGGGGLGEGLSGGASGALPGKGLIASSPGSGSQASGAGGYGSNGSGGGRQGTGGAISFRGKSGAFTTPIADDATVAAGLDPDQIIAVVQKNMGQITYCYEMGLQSRPHLKGRLAAEWIINGKGRVSMSRIANSSVDDRKVEDCIAGKIKNWKFPKPVGGVNVDVAYPFELKRVSQR